MGNKLGDLNNGRSGNMREETKGDELGARSKLGVSVEPYLMAPAHLPLCLSRLLVLCVVGIVLARCCWSAIPWPCLEMRSGSRWRSWVAEGEKGSGDTTIVKSNLELYMDDPTVSSGYV